jgi:hypothetical protein
MRRGRIFFGGFAMLAILALSAPAAYAAGGGPATNQGYPGATKPPAHHQTHGGNAGVAGTHHAVAGGVRPARAGGSLPFTGMQLGLVVLVGMLLVGGGVVLRTSGRNRTSA